MLKKMRALGRNDRRRCNRDPTTVNPDCQLARADAKVGGVYRIGCERVHGHSARGCQTGCTDCTTPMNYHQCHPSSPNSLLRPALLAPGLIGKSMSAVGAFHQRETPSRNAVRSLQGSKAGRIMGGLLSRAPCRGRDDVILPAGTWTALTLGVRGLSMSSTGSSQPTLSKT